MGEALLLVPPVPVFVPLIFPSDVPTLLPVLVLVADVFAPLVLEPPLIPELVLVSKELLILSFDSSFPEDDDDESEDEDDDDDVAEPLLREDPLLPETPVF